MTFCFWLFLFLASVSAIFAQNVDIATIIVNGTEAYTDTDANYICATVDWWPHNKCDYNQCPWGSSSALNLDLNHPFLAKAIQGFYGWTANIHHLAFERLRIRIGGSLQDQLLYDVGNLKSPCHPFQKKSDGLFGFSKGCLHMDRWDELNRLFNKTGALLVFGLNALYGRHHIKRGVWGGKWDSSNTYDLIKYTVSKGYQIDTWEFGNELSGTGIGASVDAEQYGKDVINLKAIIDELYRDVQPKPFLAAPGGFYEKDWYNKLLQVSGSAMVDVMTHHIYNLGAGVNRDLVKKILDPRHLNKVSETFKDLKETIQAHGPWASAWVGESGGAYNSGGHHVSDTFVNSFWYLDQLGMAANYSTKVYCRQTLIGGNYGLLNRTTFAPNPDYYSALLWNQLMGKEVLVVNSSASPYLRSYAHCSKGRTGVTLLLINLSNHTQFQINVRNVMNINLSTEAETNGKKRSFLRGLKRSVSWVGSKASDGSVHREEYHLTPKGGDLRSKTMLLNGMPLQLTDDGDIPSLNPTLVDVNSLISIPPLSVKFIVLPNFEAQACSLQDD